MSEGRALTNAIGNSVATMVIAGWQGERDDERFQAVLRRAVDRRPRGRARRCAARTSAGRAGDRAEGRFERESAAPPVEAGRR